MKSLNTWPATPAASVDYGDIPVLPDFCTAIAAVKLIAEQTNIAETDIVDLRFPEHQLNYPQDANTFLAGPASGAAAVPGYRAIVEADIDEVLPLNGLSDVDTTEVGTGDIIYKTAGNWEDYPLGVGIAIGNDGASIKMGDIAGYNYMSVNVSTGEVALVGNATAFKDMESPLIGEQIESPASHITRNIAETQPDIQRWMHPERLCDDELASQSRIQDRRSNRAAFALVADIQ